MVEEARRYNFEPVVYSASEVLNTPKISSGRYFVFCGVNILLNSSQALFLADCVSRISDDAFIAFFNHEPFWDYRCSNIEYIFGKKVFIYNVYNGKAFPGCFAHYFGVGGILWRSRIKNIELPPVQLLKDRFDKSRSSGVWLCAYASCFHDFRLTVPNSLMIERNDLIKDFWDRGVCDVFGKNWTGRWKLETIEESRAGRDGKSWGEIKMEHSAKNYLFSICLENSFVQNYVTEKLAQAIEAFLLPIYKFGNGVEEYINPDLCFDLRNYENLDCLYHDLSCIEFDEYYERLRLVVEQYNGVISNVDLVNKERLRPAQIVLEDVLRECGCD